MLDPGRDQPRNSFPLSDGIGNRIHRYKYNSWEAMNSGFWASNQVDMVESGIISPPLWTRSPPRIPQNGKNYYQSLSPESRTQAIARGQRELMEMVRNMPETSYELSLKDLVEKPSVEAGEENEIQETNLINKNVRSREGNRSNSRSRNIDQTALVKRSGNVYNGGFYLKMIFPTSLGSKKKKKKNGSSGNDSSKASLRPSASEGSLKDCVDKEWWKNSPSASVDGESGATSINSGSTESSGSTSSSNSSRSNSRRERSVGSCWFLIGKPRNLTRE